MSASDLLELGLAYLSENQPDLPRNQLAVSHGPAGMSTHENNPMARVNRPCKHYSVIFHFKERKAWRVQYTSIKKSQRQPACPPMPLMCKRPYAKIADKISAKLIAVQKNARRMDSSACV